MKVIHEKPWYVSALSSFLIGDVPHVVGLTPAAFERDVTTLVQRCAVEGEGFLTKTLPSLGKAIDLALQGASPLDAPGFKKIHRRSALPAFLQALTRKVFNLNGTLADSPCIKSIRLLRQICFWCKKIEKGFTDESLRAALNDFKEVDGSLPTRSDLPACRLLGIARAIIQSIFARGPDLKDLKPQHGPGAVANRDGVIGKRYLRRKYTALERCFRPIPFFLSLRDAAEDPRRVTGRFECEFGLSRTTFVEKDSSGPRTIGLEQAEYMWCQQALKRSMYAHIEKHPLTRGHVNFTDQSINRGLTAKWADFDTLDMSKASDRNSLALVEFLFEKTKIWPYLLASRSPGSVLPDGSILWFKKFAPMGSAVCFPVEALVFFSLALASLHLQGMPLSIARRNVYVYGDDLVVPHGYFTQMKLDFELVGLKFNDSKCCVSGKFRESCGLDAYDGVDVTPVRLRKAYPNDDPTTYIPLVKHANRLYMRGYRAASLAFRKAALKNFRILRSLKLPTSPRLDLPILYWMDDSCPETVRYQYRNSLCQIRGYASKPCVQKGTRSGELSYLREALSRGGPVGRLSTSKVGVERVFDVPMRATLRKGLFVLPPEFSGVQPQWVSKLP